MSNVAAIVAAGSQGATATSLIDPAECVFEPERPTVEQAHKIMQGHLRCRTAVCQHRKVALEVLVGAGRYVLP